jgi:4-hydroxy-tetrahydrodipicolinate reductase
MADMRLIVTGAAGRMGRMLIKAIAETPGVTLAAAIERKGAAALGADASLLAGVGASGIMISDDPLPATLAADGVVDFSVPAASVEMAALAAQARIAHVVGTTGLTEADLAKIAAAARHAPIVRSGNMSLGVNLLARLVRDAARALGADYDVEIVEMHHRMKVDAPSGTALMLGEAAADGRAVDLKGHSERGRDGVTGPRKPGAIGFASLRGGTVVGDHSVIFAGDGERVVLSHHGPLAVRARRDQGGLMGARPQAGPLLDGRRAGLQRGLRRRRPRPLQHRHRIAVVGRLGVGREAELRRYARRGGVPDLDDAGHARAGMGAVGPGDRGAHRLFRQASPVHRGDKHPAGFHRPLVRRIDHAAQIVEAGLADERAAGAVLQREEAEAEIAPNSDVAQEAGPGRLARYRLAADETYDLRRRPHPGVGFEIFGAMRAKAQAGRFERHGIGEGQGVDPVVGADRVGRPGDDCAIVAFVGCSVYRLSGNLASLPPSKERTDRLCEEGRVRRRKRD